MMDLKWKWTVPNLLSAFRIVLVPAIAATYLSGCDLWVPVLLLALSGISDLLDGAIARKFNQISDIGKLLDPVADKLTQVTVIVCLAITNPLLWWLVVIIGTKELLQCIGALLLLGQQISINGAQWFGKITTTVFYIAVVFIVAFPGMPMWVYWPLVGVVALFMIATFIGYIRAYFQMKRAAKASAEECIQKENESV